MNDARLVGIVMNDEDYFRVELKAAYGDPAALAIVEAVRQRMKLQVQAVREAWGYSKSGGALALVPSRIDPINEPRANNSEEQPRSNVLPFRLPTKGRGPDFPPAA